MRISDTKVVQLIESAPFQVVILDEFTGEEVALNQMEIVGLRAAIEYFLPTALKEPPGAS